MLANTHALSGNDNQVIRDTMFERITRGGDSRVYGGDGNDYLDGSKDFISSIRTILNPSYTISRNSMIL
jgi:hypothetical protein